MTDTPISDKALEATEIVARAMYSRFQKQYLGRKDHTPGWENISHGDQNEWLELSEAAITTYLETAEAEGWTLVRTSIISGDAERKSHCDTGHNDEEIFSEGGSLMK